MAQLTIQQAFDRALQHHQAGRLQEAAQLYRQVLAQQPEHADATHLLGVIARAVGQHEIAVDLIRRAIALNRNLPGAQYNLGNALADKRQLDEAIDAYRQAIALNPDFPEAHSNLGIALKDKGQLDEAVTAFRQAMALNPQLPGVHNNLGNALKDLGQADEAIAAFGQAIRLHPKFAEAHNGLGAALKDNGRLDEAISAYRQAIALSPNYAEAHRNLSLALLARGDFQQGWEEYEWRWKCKDHPRPRNFAQPQWDGSPLEARTLLLHAEQGFGDAIQFVRYLPLVAHRGGKIIFECHVKLQRLFQTVADGRQIVAAGGFLPAFDLHCPLLSLPRILGTNLSNLPNSLPYLRPDPHDAATWQRRMDDHGSIVKVGLVWAGSRSHKNDRNRSMKLARMVPLAQVIGARFFSLQKGEAADETKSPSAGMGLVDWTGQIKDFADTAALISNLDLVIAVDTAIAHLAGAMGKPVWTLLPFVSDWRWFLDRDDSPWYPSMRLFRQPARGDWDSVISQVVEELSRWVRQPEH